MAGCHCENKFDIKIRQQLAENSLSRPIKSSNGSFGNPFPTWSHPNLLNLFQFLVCEKNEINLPNSEAELEKELPILKPNFQIEQQETTKDQFRATWIGHATCLIQVDGLNILTDPIFSQRASPSQYYGPKRYREAACNAATLPEHIDFVLISHNHYDHLDTTSVDDINKRFGDKCRWLVPLGLGSYLKSMNVKNYLEMDWWDKDCYHLEGDKRVAIYLTPNQHWSRRGLADENKTLWGSYTIVNKFNSSFYFAGDTGYCLAFKEIGNIFEPMSGAAIPIGAYKPRWFMKAGHVDPAEAIQIHQDLKSFKSIAIHHATFPLSNEFYKEPSMLLNDLMKSQDSSRPFTALKHGESSLFVNH